MNLFFFDPSRSSELGGFFTSTVCQIKRNTSSEKTSYAVFQSKHFRGRLLILESA